MTGVSLWQKAKVYKCLGALIRVNTFLSRVFLIPYHQYLKQKEYKRLELLPSFAPLGLVGFPYTEDTIHGEIGLGVYQGRLLVIGQSEAHRGLPRRWVVDKLNVECPCHRERDIPCLLFEAAIVILQNLQSCPVTQDLRKVDQTELSKHYPHSKEQDKTQFSLLKGDNIGKTLGIEQILRLLRQYSQECLIRQHPAKGNDTQYYDN